jgi:hypothetical protein
MGRPSAAGAAVPAMKSKADGPLRLPRVLEAAVGEALGWALLFRGERRIVEGEGVNSRT